MILVDANVFIYAAGRESPRRKPCQRWLRRHVGRAGAKDACTNAEVLQEILHRYRAIARPDLGLRIFDDVVALGLPILPVSEADLRHARELIGKFPVLSTRDAVHLGVMRTHELTRVVSYDRGLDQVPWVERLEP